MNNFRHLIETARADLYMTEEFLRANPRAARVNQTEQAVVMAVLEQTPRGSVVADVPCGNGRMTQLAAQRGMSVIPADFNLSMLQAMANRNNENGFLGRRLSADITALPLPDKSVDLFLNMRLLHHILDWPTQLQMYREIVRVTRGRVVTTFWNSRCWHWFWYSLRRKLRQKPFKSSAVSRSYFTNLCLEAGLTVEEIVPALPFKGEDCMAVCGIA